MPFRGRLLKPGLGDELGKDSETYRKITLPNGLRIVNSFMPHTRSVSVTIFVGAGSRYESDAQAGLSHFIEHLFFKGTAKRPTAKAISEAIESVGGVINAGTDRELTVYWVKVAAPHFDLALDVVADTLLHSKFEPAEIEKERQVVIEELNMIRDDPREWVDVIIDEVIWPGQALGRDVAGTKETVSSFTREMSLDYLACQYTPSNTVVSVAGSVPHEQVVAAVSRALGDWQPGRPASFAPALDSQGSPRLRLEPKRTEQAHLCLAVPGLPMLHPDRFALDLLNVVLGEGMSSRLFQEIREKHGLAYDVHSYVSHFLDTGSVTVYAGVDPRRINPAIEAILGELNRLKDQVPESELTKAREYSKGRLLLRMEDTRSVAGWVGAQELLTDRVLTVDDVVEIIDSITPADLERVARQLFLTEKLNLAVVGPYRSERRFADLLRF